METERTSYLPPQCETLELQTERVIAASVGGYEAWPTEGI